MQSWGYIHVKMISRSRNIGSWSSMQISTEPVIIQLYPNLPTSPFMWSVSSLTSWKSFNLIGVGQAHLLHLKPRYVHTFNCLNISGSTDCFRRRQPLLPHAVIICIVLMTHDCDRFTTKDNTIQNGYFMLDSLLTSWVPYWLLTAYGCEILPPEQPNL